MTATLPTAPPSAVTPRGYFSRVVGIDLSLASTGLAVYYPDGRAAVDSIKTVGKRGDSLADRAARIALIADTVMLWPGTTDLIVVEAPSFGAAGGSTWDRAGLWWEVVGRSVRLARVATVNPTTRAKWAAGSGRSDKAAVAAAIARRMPNVDLANSDESDALALALMGAQWLGWLATSSRVQADAVNGSGAVWPEVPAS